MRVRFFIGRKPPKWFAEQSDGCTLPLGRAGQVLLRGGQARCVCERHDFGYYLRDIQWSKDFPASKVAWVAAKMAADMELKFNRKQVAKYSFIGRIYAALYFRAVRVGAHKYAIPIEELPVPPTWIAMQNLTAFFEEPFTPRADRVLALWAKILLAG